MLHVTIDPRNGGLGGISDGCVTCCCTPVMMRPGEKNLMRLDYAPWSVPLKNGGPGIMTGTAFDIVRDTSACSTATEGGFAPPNNSLYFVSTAVDTPVAIDVAANVTPAGNTFEYRELPLQGPFRGALSFSSPSTFTYTPQSGFVGRDWFYFETKDAQGRTIIRYARINVGSPIPAEPLPPFLGLRIPSNEVMVDQRLQQITFPLDLAPDARTCDVFKVNVRQPARDCDRTFHHLTCFEVRVGRC